ncbi:hypothetical protein ACQR36_17245 [Rhodococcus erythropolis]|uniref:hypothetical protein n=1 Tax=Rhodococcus erythropolis TaxID=1833 RepID=UPI001E2B003F|nr:MULTISPECIES: hypothetical protein [Rhodococcus erythropolis group]MCD2104872.1 hypothetical protein [Rhodococcus qingshengii]MCZ4525000.1 hypothetical protein [Rhodococcus erythropolis]
MLTYDDELALSDRLVARRQVRDKLCAEERAPTEEEAAILSDGETAATDLVRAYLPYISKLASTICDRNIENKSSVGWDRDDLFDEGVIAALKVTNSFNARGTNNHPGVRFANYSSLAISKAMNRLIAKNSTPYRADTAAIQATWSWLAATDEFVRDHGRRPTDEELEDITGFACTYVLPSIPSRSTFGDVHDPVYVSIPETDPASISDDAAYKQSAELLLEVLETMLAEKYMKYARILFCADGNVPYEAGNAARILGVPTRRVEAVNEYLLNFISHPRYRVWAYEIIKEKEAIRKGIRASENRKRLERRRSTGATQGQSDVTVHVQQHEPRADQLRTTAIA